MSFCIVVNLGKKNSSANDKPLVGVYTNPKCSCHYQGAYTKVNNVYHLKTELKCFCTLVTLTIIIPVPITNHSIASALVFLRKKLMLTT